MQNYIEEQAYKRLKKKKGFYTHLGVYIAVGLFFFAMNMATLGEDPAVWFFFPLLPWGVGVLIHYFSVFGIFGTVLSQEWEDRQLEREKQRIYNAIRNEMNAEGYLPEEENEESLDLESLKELRRMERRWNEEDLV